MSLVMCTGSKVPESDASVLPNLAIRFTREGSVPLRTQLLPGSDRLTRAELPVVLLTYHCANKVR